MTPTLLVLAAGVGSRYGGRKQIDRIGPSGETIIDYSIYDAIRAGFGKVVFVIRKDIEADFKEVFAGKFEDRIDVRYAFQELDKLPDGFTVPEGRTKPWGTGHAVLMAADQINEPFVMINADDFYGADSYKVAADFMRETGDDPSIFFNVGFILKNTLSDHGTVTRGVCSVDGDGFLATINERFKIRANDTGVEARDIDGNPLSLTGNEIASMNFLGFHHSVFDYLKTDFSKFLEEKREVPKSEHLIPEVMNDHIQKGLAKVKVLESNDRWLGVTYQEDKPIVMEGIRKKVADGLYPENLWDK